MATDGRFHKCSKPFQPRANVFFIYIARGSNNPASRIAIASWAPTVTMMGSGDQQRVEETISQLHG
jgi:hypothetical protein